MRSQHASRRIVQPRLAGAGQQDVVILPVDDDIFDACQSGQVQDDFRQRVAARQALFDRLLEAVQ